MIRNCIANLTKNRTKGMELVQVAILIAIAISIGLLFRSQITSYVNTVFSELAENGV